MNWAGHMDGQNEICKIAKKSREEETRGFPCRKRGRPQVRCKDCLKRDLRNAEEEESITAVAIQHCDK